MIEESEIQLVHPEVALVASHLESLEEMRALGETIWEGWLPRDTESPADYVERVRRNEHDPDPGLVPATIYWAVRDGRVVGRIALRHHLTESLREFGGHIGYEVRPSCRRQGIAKAMLAQLLELPRPREIGRLLLTCATDNEASIRTILANGGVFEGEAHVESRQRWTSYYWIDLNQTGGVGSG